MVEGFKFNHFATFPAFIPFSISEIALFFFNAEFLAISTHGCCLQVIDNVKRAEVITTSFLQKMKIPSLQWLSCL